MSDHHDDVHLEPAQVNLAGGSMWRKLPILGLLLGAGGLGASFALKGGHEDHFWHSYLVAWFGFLAICLGGLFFVIVQYLVRAGWSIAVRRLAENAAICLPVMCLLGLPILFGGGSHTLYHWLDIEVLRADPMLAAKEGYLNEGFFIARVLTYFVVWTVLSIIFYVSSVRGDRDPEIAARNADRMRGFAAPALFFFALSLTFGAFDFLMSLDPHWFSTMFGVYYFAGTCLSIHAFLTLMAIFLRKSGYLKGVVTDEHYHDLGKFLFGFTVFYTYIAFAQYFLIWYANIPEETFWFAYRIEGDFLKLTILLCLGRFPIPFFFLLPRGIKRMSASLFVAATWILFMEFVDMYWLIQPVLAHHHAIEAGDPHAMSIHLGSLDALTWVGMFGAFLGTYSFFLGRAPLVPVKDPRIAESVKFENF